MAQSKEAYLSSFSPAKNGIKGKCPHCQETSMFQSPLKLKTSCEKCGLNYSFAAPADGPSFFAMSLMMLVSSVWVVLMKVKYDVSGLFIIATTLPLLVFGTIGLLHLFRGWFVSAEYFIKVRDGRILYQSEKIS